VTNRGRLLTKDEIMSAVWPDTIVEESNLTQNISILRRALGDVRGDNAFIVTVPGRGYKFVPDVRSPTVEAPEGDEPVVETEQAHSHIRPIAPLIAGVGVLIVTVAAWYLISSNRTTAGQPPKTLAILPFKPLVPENSDEVLEMGMTDTLIARMSSSPGLVLRPLSSVRRFAQGDTDPQEAGRELGADAVLEGNIQRWGEKIRVNVRLINVSNGESLWSSTFDNEYTDIFSVQDAISGRVAEALRSRLTETKTSGATQNIEAYRFYLQGRLYQFKSTPQAIRQAISFYQKAIELDPNYALAYAGMSDAYRMLPITSDVPPNEAFPQSKAAALKALELDDQLSEAHLALGYVDSWYEWDWRTAEGELRKAVGLSPSSSDAHRGLSLLLTATGRHDEAVAEMQLARELDPVSLPTNALEAQALHYAGRETEAIQRLDKTFEIDPNFWIARLMLARIYIQQGRFPEALSELDRARTASGGNSEAISLTGYVLARLGRRDEARRSLDELRAMAGDTYSPSYNIAIVYSGLDDHAAALRWLEDAVERHDVRLVLLKVEPKWDPYRNEPRFINILRKIGLDQK
ncbi:MAG TPA: tetratricopeptide repeat protein, partial [Pyrinomonadaceae bacterium]|nr:tetratricopeptide repeat protein [Pyrinomonadaceae bacterium]